MNRVETMAGESALSFVSGTSGRPLLYRTVDGVLKAAAGEIAGSCRRSSCRSNRCATPSPNSTARSSGPRVECSPAD